MKIDTNEEVIELTDDQLAEVAGGYWGGLVPVFA